jgi:hypothetical protein
MTHLTSDELIDAVEEVLPAERRRHVAACEACRLQVDDLAAALNDAKQVSVPEPSPLFWTHFSTRVNDAIDAESAGAWPQWLRWQVLLPLGATAMIILGLMLAVPKPERSEMSVAIETPAAVEAPGDNWVMVAALVGDIDLDTAVETGVIEPGVAERAVLSLTPDEQQELTRLLKAELTRAKS